MGVTPQATNTAPQQIDAVLELLAEQVRLRIPAVQCRIHHGANEHFAWWVVARLSNPKDDSKIVDVSIECRSAESGLSIQADLAREDGTVLQEFLGDHIDVPSSGDANGELQNAFRGIEDFLLGQVECLVGELA